MPEQTFRYAFCGGTNTVLGLSIFYVFLKLVFREQVVDLGFYVFEAYTVALVISFCVNFTVGFLLMKYVVFVDSKLRGRIQIFRYFLSFTSSKSASTTSSWAFGRGPSCASAPGPAPAAPF